MTSRREGEGRGGGGGIEMVRSLSAMVKIFDTDSNINVVKGLLSLSNQGSSYV